MSYQSASFPAFRTLIASWIEEKGEVLVMIRFSHAGGNKSYEFFRDFSSFEKRLEELPSKTCLIVFRNQQLPMRGVVDEIFIEKAKNLVNDEEEYLFTELNLTVRGKCSWYDSNSDISHALMEDDLRESLGSEVAFGHFPPWLHDSESVASAVIPEHNGELICGIY